MPSFSRGFLNLGVTLTPHDGSGEIHTYDNWGAQMVGSPAYGSKVPKRVLIDIPYSDITLDFSHIANDRLYFEESEITYQFVYIPKIKSLRSRILDISTTQAQIDSYLWSFNGDIHDDYMSAKGLCGARVSNLEFSPDIANGILNITVTFTGRYQR